MAVHVPENHGRLVAGTRKEDDTEKSFSSVSPSFGLHSCVGPESARGPNGEGLYGFYLEVTSTMDDAGGVGEHRIERWSFLPTPRLVGQTLDILGQSES